MRNLKLVSVIASLALLVVCFGHMAFDAFGYESPQPVVISNNEPVVLAQFKITSDRPIEIRSLAFRVDAADGLPEFSSVEITCDTCTRL